MLCILAVFLPSFFMEGAARALFVPLSLAVGFAMLASYILSSTFVPVLSVWLLRHAHAARIPEAWSSRLRGRFRGMLERLVRARRMLVLGVSGRVRRDRRSSSAARLGTEIFPLVDAGEFRLRLRAPMARTSKRRNN